MRIYRFRDILTSLARAIYVRPAATMGYIFLGSFEKMAVQDFAYY